MLRTYMVAATLLRMYVHACNDVLCNGVILLLINSISYSDFMNVGSKLH